ncbi:RHS repeat domain-containing protein [Flavobacterium sp. N1736]|uniref:RHS repeat domain-containing protein n=1 Tax=Flavobacterium sp. N1736 TaxID=2986823 RepID=UPI002225780D|nr:RHS repeat-associated core domain-containing protein [Flavobacterium sp. N1736]
MKIFIYYLILLPVIVFANPSLPEGNKEIMSYHLTDQVNYPDTTINLVTSDLIKTTSGAGSGTLTIKNNILTLTLIGSWSPQQMKVGVIKNLNVSPTVPNMELGPITLADGKTFNGFYAKIENNALVFYSPFYFTGVNTTLSADLPDGTGPLNGAVYSYPFQGIFTCSPSGGGSAGGTIDIHYSKATLTLSGGWDANCVLKTGQIVSLGSTIVPNTDLGTIKYNGNNTNFGAKIESNWLVFYTYTTPILPGNCSMNVSRDLNERLALDVPNDKLNNWIHDVSYDSKGNIISQNRSYFDDLAKSNVSLSKDYVTNKIWGTEITYDNFARPDKISFIAPSPLSTFDKTNFFKTPEEISASVLPNSLTVTSPTTTSKTVQASDFILGVSTINPGLTVSFKAKTILLQDGFNATSTGGGVFTATSMTFPDNTLSTNLGNYYSDNNTDEPYQATAAQPFIQKNYDNLNPGNVINAVSGNKINGDWRTGYSYTVPAAQEMYYVYGSDYFDGYTFGGKEIVISKYFKTVTVDPNGNENVTFTDGEGKPLATARSGGATSYPVVSLIGTQGYVDVHIPKGIQSSQISLIQNNSLYKAYDLKTGLEITPITSSSFVGGNAYRIVAIDPPVKDYDTYIIQFDGGVAGQSGGLGISYSVNYYDFAVNVYNKTGQLIRSIQPNGYTTTSNVVGTPTHMTSTDFVSTYKYNALGQLIETSSPDAGISKFAYRKDGQIRFSQNALQAINNQFASYTDYDSMGRPVESGVYNNVNDRGAVINFDGIWPLTTEIEDPGYFSYRKSERSNTIYDSEDISQLPTNLTLTAVLRSQGIGIWEYSPQNNLSGNVAVTYTSSATGISAITWYSYDIYGRVEWIVQYNEGLGAKTINYEYDYRGNIKKALFHKNKADEMFVHQYSYDLNNVLIKVETSTDNINFTTQADYSYYKTGKLKRINIAQGAQGLDYVYTLTGQLKSINHPSLEAGKDPGGDSNDVFGLTLDYYNGDYLRTGKNITSSPTIGADYNGNIKASRWANKGIAGDYSGSSANQKGYLYNYDRNNWLTSATFGNTNSATAAISPASSLAEKGLTYDANGNIRTLQRTNETGTVVDNLTYNYTNAGRNQLNSITESAAVTADVNDIENQAQGNYIYDNIGQLRQNVSENLFYFYNTKGLVTEVKKGPNTLVKFFYNERGQRIAKESYDTTNFTLQNTTFYAVDLSGNPIAVYNLPSGGSITQTDLPIYGLSRLGVYNKPSAKSSYEITDHLGNVRAVIEKQGAVPVIKSYADYYPFGEQLPTRNSLSNYRYAFQGQEFDKETGMEAFKLRLWDGRIGRWLSTDPAGQYASLYLGMGNNPISGVDPDGAKNIRFNESGDYIGVDHDVWWHNLLFGSRGQYAGGNNKWVNFRFNDEDDAARFELDKEDYQYLSGIDLNFFKENLQGMIDKGIGPAKELGIIDKYKYIYYQSQGGGSLDYIDNFYSKKLHVFNGIAYNNPDAGNFAWAQSMSQLGISWGDVKFGSEFNGFWNGKYQNSQYSPRDDAFYKRITFFGDSAADQRAIHTGYNTHYIDGKWQTIIYQH